eukprot:Amastigsp_a512830_16.p4 type:complete len:107 gc:universal Amastigsp_a512830_16:597-277(-)
MIEEHVLGFEIAVHNPEVVKVCKPERKLCRVVERMRRLKKLERVEKRREVPARDVLESKVKRDRRLESAQKMNEKRRRRRRACDPRQHVALEQHAPDSICVAELLL